MLTEIDKDFYCSSESRNCEPWSVDTGNCTGCSYKHRKFPTPEQFKIEYGFDYPDDGAVYALYNFEDKDGNCWHEWIATTRKLAMDNEINNNCVVCACTPFGKPDNTWRPE